MLVLGQLEKKTFQQIAFFGFPRVVWPTPGCGIEIRDQDQALAKCDHRGSCNGRYTPSSQGILAGGNNSSPWTSYWDRELLMAGPNLLLVPSSQGDQDPVCTNAI